MQASEEKPAKKKRKKGGGSGKGPQFERDMSRRFTKWITEHERPEIFWRAASSGAKFTQDRRSGKKTKLGGDMVAIDPAGEFFAKIFSFEYKFYKDFGTFESLIKDQGMILDWWEQCMEDALATNRYPLLVFKKNYYPPYLAITFTAQSLLRDIFGKDSEPNHIRFVLSKFAFVVYQLEEWLEWVDPEALKANTSVFTGGR